MTGRCKGQEKPGSISEVKVKQNDHSTSKPTMAPADKKANVSKERLEKIRSQSPLKYENKTSSTSESLFHAQTYHDDELPHQVFDDEGIVLHDPYVTIDSKHHHHHKHKPEYHPPPHDHHDHHHHDHHDHNHYHHHRPKPAKYHKHVKKIDHHHIEPYPVSFLGENSQDLSIYFVILSCVPQSKIPDLIYDFRL
jgi:hypothetical protein